MEFTISKDLFSKAVSRTQSIIEKKSTLPILSNVLLDASEDMVEFVATDLEVGTRGRYSAKVNKGGKITLAAKKLFEIIRELPEGDIELKGLENNWVAISSGRARFRLAGLSAEDFPTLPSFDDAEFEEFDADIIAEMIDKTSFAMSTDETRYYLNGVFIEPKVVKEKSMLRMVATDGHRLSLIERPVKSLKKLKISKGIIVPKKGINEIKKLTAEGEEPIQIALKERNIMVKRDDVEIVIRLIDGDFPDYNKVIPTKNEKKIIVDREALLHAFRRTSILSSEMTRGVKLSLKANTLEISSNTPDIGEAKEELDINYTGDKLDIGFNARYFIELLSAMDSEEVSIELSDHLSPGVIRSADDDGYTSVIMPMRL